MFTRLVMVGRISSMHCLKSLVGSASSLYDFDFILRMIFLTSVCSKGLNSASLVVIFFVGLYVGYLVRLSLIYCILTMKKSANSSARSLSLVWLGRGFSEDVPISVFTILYSPYTSHLQSSTFLL